MNTGASPAGQRQRSRLDLTTTHSYPGYRQKRTFICISRRLHSRASITAVLSLTPPTLRNRRSANKQPRPPGAAGARATSAGKPNPSPLSQQTKQPGP